MKIYVKKDRDIFGNIDGYYSEIGTLEELLKPIMDIAKYSKESGTSMEDFIIWLEAYINGEKENYDKST